jgi:hypothetical protein
MIDSKPKTKDQRIILAAIAMVTKRINAFVNCKHSGFPRSIPRVIERNG